MIGIFFTFLSIVIIARVLFSFIGYNYGPIYDFVFSLSEKILAPVRKRLPASRIDWSPLIVLIVFDFMAKFLPLFITAAVGGEWGAALYILYYVLLSTLSSIITFFIIIFIVKYFNDLTGRNNYSLTALLEEATGPLIGKVRSILPFGYKKYSFWASAVILIAVRIILQRIITSF
ncbi:MAG: YggT family protein [Candidatus Delongbacteria bacterium]|nr:YggT family protein [Candidatus Delongbacteria bacterium]MDD4205367.1 YggT family protein [Candidatus Delongbacteria bacterium]